MKKPLNCLASSTSIETVNSNYEYGKTEVEGWILYSTKDTRRALMLRVTELRGT